MSHEYIVRIVKEGPTSFRTIVPEYPNQNPPGFPRSTEAEAVVVAGEQFELAMVDWLKAIQPGAELVLVLCQKEET